MAERTTIVPTTNTIDHFSFSEIPHNMLGASKEREEKKGSSSHLSIRKSWDGKSDSEVKQIKYDIADFIYHTYRIRYRPDTNSQWGDIPNSSLNKADIRAYSVCDAGLWYVREETLFYADAQSGSCTRIGKLSNVTQIKLMADGKLWIEQCAGIKQTVQNRYDRYWHSFIEDYLDDYIDEYEITYKNIVVDPAKYANRFRGWSQTFTCPRCKAPLYSGMENCPHCGTYLGDTSNASDAYEYEIHSENWLMKKPEGKEHYFQMVQKRPGEWLLNYHIDAGSRGNSTAIYNDWLGERVYSISRNLVNGKKTLVELSVHGTDKIELAHIEDGTLSVTDCGIFVVSKGKKSTTISWLTHDGKFKKNITLPGDITQTYLCGDLVFYLRKEINNWDILNSAYWMDLNDEQEYCIIRAEKKKIRANVKHSEYVNSTHIGAETIFGNELGAVIKLHFMYADNADCVPKAEQVFHETEGWYYYSFEEKNMHCLSSPARGPHNAYFKPEEYTQWKDDYFDNHFHNLDIAAFNMEKNLMWVMIRKNGKICWAPMNITTDPLKQLRPDLPIWQNPPCSNRREVVYFDGQHCYAYMGDSPFASIDAKGQREEWPIRYYAVDAGSFVVSEDCIMIEGKLQGNLNSIPGYSVLAQKTVEGIGAFVFPASHKFKKIKGSVQFE